MYTPCTGEFERIMRDDSREPFAAEAVCNKAFTFLCASLMLQSRQGNVAGISLAPSTLPGHLAQFYAECPFGCIVSEALLIQDLRAGQADHALTSLIVAYSLRYSEDASVRQRSEELFAFASDILLGRVWSNDSQELFNNGIAFCLIARWWQLKKQYRKSLTLFLVASMFARHYLNLNYEPRDNFRSYYSLKQQTQIQICNTIAWVSSAHLIMPAIGLDFESECMFGVRPA